MANNRLYILDTVTGDKFLLAKSGGGGWYLTLRDSFEDWISDRDVNSSWGNCPGRTVLKLVDENNYE